MYFDSDARFFWNIKSLVWCTAQANFGCMAVSFARNATFDILGVRVGSVLVPNDDIVGMGGLLRERSSKEVRDQLNEWIGGYYANDFSMKKSAFFYARFFVEEYRPSLAGVDDSVQWDLALLRVLIDMRLTDVQFD